MAVFLCIRGEQKVMETDNVKYCLVCGRRIVSPIRKKYCCKAHYNKARNGAKLIDVTDIRDDLTAIQQKAQQKGLSYGQYVALYMNNK